ncbi:flagellar biosynthesis protein FlhA, partial [Gammaproteobacteria bacterium 54_18_T64]
ILVINIVGGIAVGTLQHDLSMSQAAHNYVLLTIGDGLVAQIPSLLLSTAAAIIVTRASDAQDMGQQMGSQLFQSPKALIITACIMASLGVIPGMPNLVFLFLAAVLGGGAFLIIQKDKIEQQIEPVAEPVAAPPEVKELGWEDVASVDPIGLEVGYRLIPLVDKNQDGELLGRVKGVRKKLSQDLGFLVQPVHIRDNLDLSPNAYRITLHGVPLGESEIHPGKEMAINPGQVFGTLNGVATKDPAFGLDAMWVEPSLRDEAQTMGYTVVDCSTVIATHLSELLKQHAHELLGHDEVQQLLDLLAKSSPKLVENLVADALSLSVVLKVMQNLLAENIPIKDVRTIAESLAENAPKSQEADVLTAQARVALSRTIYQQINGMAPELEVMTLDPELEQILLNVIQGSPTSGGLEPGLADNMLQQIGRSAQVQATQGQTPVLLVATALRTWLSNLVRAANPGLHVLSYDEIPPSKQLKVIHSVGR